MGEMPKAIYFKFSQTEGAHDVIIREQKHILIAENQFFLRSQPVLMRWRQNISKPYKCYYNSHLSRRGHQYVVALCDKYQTMHYCACINSVLLITNPVIRRVQNIHFFFLDTVIMIWSNMYKCDVCITSTLYG